MKNAQPGLLPSTGGMLLADLRQPSRQFRSAGSKAKMNLFGGHCAQAASVPAKREGVSQASFRGLVSLGRGSSGAGGQVNGESY